MRVLSKQQAERLFQAGDLSPHEAAATAQIKAERRQRATIKRYVPTQRSETACMSSGRKSHGLFKWTEHDSPGEVRHVLAEGKYRSHYAMLEAARLEAAYNRK